MKRGHAVAMLLLSLFLARCEEKVVYRDDPRLCNDAFHGDIVGRILQKGVDAVVLVSQEIPVDSTAVSGSDGTFRIGNLPVGNYDLTIRADGYRTFTLHNVMVNGAGTTYIGEVDLSTVPDLVSYHYPRDGDEIVFDGRHGRLSVSMAFTRPMDRESVEEAFSTDPPSEGIFYWGSYVYYRDDVSDGFDKSGNDGAVISTYSRITSFTYTLAQKDSYTDTTYTVTLSTAAQDTAGNHLRFPLVFSFRTIRSASSLQGIQTVPSDGDVDVGLISTGGIQITFPRNMDPGSTEKALSMTPDVERIYIWPEKNRLTIYTGGPFMADTEYTIVIDADARDLDGNPLGEPFSFSFTTAPVSVESTQPRNGELFVSYENPYITLRFNTYMVKSTVEEAFHISPDVDGSFRWEGKNGSGGKNSITFFPSKSLAPNTKYTVTLGTEAEDIYGAGLKEPYTFSFITRPE